MTPNLPTGTVTFLFTDIEGSTNIAQAYPGEWERLRGRHHEILRSAIQAHHGYVFQIVGDEFCAVFHTALDALTAALTAQQMLMIEDWKPARIKVRMGINTGTAEVGNVNDPSGGYTGYRALARVNRVMSAGHGGQVLLSNTSAELVRGELPQGVNLRDMGEHRLKGLLNVEHLWQADMIDLPQEFPPLKTLEAIARNMPVQLTSFIGREKEIAAGLEKLKSELPQRAPVLMEKFQEYADRILPSLKTSSTSLSDRAYNERTEALVEVNRICLETLDISFNALCLGETPPEYNPQCPFRGLESFRPEDREYFFGRGVLTKKLVGKIKAYPFLAVLGASGSGKSSLVMAGLVPALGGEYAIFRPGVDPLDELETALASVPEKSLLVVDQFEETFTLASDETRRREFIAKLLEATRTYKVVLTMRSDFLGEVASYRSLNEEIQNHLEIVPPMDTEELYQAMEGQAGCVGLRFEADLGQQILNDVEGEPGAMPLLQHALWMLWKRRHGLWLKTEEYQSFGGVRQAIASTAEDVYGSCSEAEQERIRDIFLRLTRLDQGGDGRDTRRRVPLSDLIPVGHDATFTTLLLDKLANARLIVKTVGESRTEIEVAHEALIRYWERLRGWLNQDREKLRLRESVTESAREWIAADREASLLNHRGGRLDDALQLGSNSHYSLTAQEQEYLNACADARNQEVNRRKRLQRRILVGLTVFSSVVAALLVFALVQLNLARAQQLGSQAQVSFADGNYNIALLYAYQSNLIHKNDAAGRVISQIPYVNYISGRGLIGQTDDYFSSVAWSPDGRLASGSYDGTVLIWDVATGQLVQTLVGHSGIVYSVAWSADGRLASGSSDGTVIVWDLATGQPALTLEGHYGNVYSVAWSKDGRLASGGGDQTVIVWDLETGEPAQFLEGHNYAVYSVAWSADGHLASGSNDGTAIIWNLQEGKPAQTLKGHTASVFAVAWSADGRLATASDDTTAIVWDLATGQPARILRGHSSSVSTLAWSADGQLATGSNDATVILWDLETGRPAQIVRGHTDDVQGVAWSADGRLASASYDGSVVVWDTQAERFAQTLRGHTAGTWKIAWSPDGQLASGADDNKVIVWDLETGLPAQILEGHTSSVYNVAWSADGRLASGAGDGTIIIWDLVTGQPAQTLKGFTYSVDSVAWSADGRLASGSDDGTVFVWDLGTGQPAQTLTGHSGGVYSVAWSADGRLASGSYDDTVILWNLETGQPAQILNGHTNSVESVAWSADGQLASASVDHTVIVWNLETGEPAHILQGHTDSVWSVDWSADGRLVSGSSDGTVIVWDLAAEQPARILRGQASGVRAVAWGVDGSLASGSMDGTIKVLSPEMVGFEPCDRIFRNMTTWEWEQTQSWLYAYRPACANLGNPLDDFLNAPLSYTWQGRTLLLGIAITSLAGVFILVWAISKLVKRILARRSSIARL